jgi:hypothetical protein
MFLAVVTWFMNFSKIALVFFCPEQGDTFVPNLVQIGRAAADKIWREKKSKPTGKHNITEILKYCIFAKTEI